MSWWDDWVCEASVYNEVRAFHNACNDESKEVTQESAEWSTVVDYIFVQRYGVLKNGEYIFFKLTEI